MCPYLLNFSQYANDRCWPDRDMAGSRVQRFFVDFLKRSSRLLDRWFKRK
jgi:hypothetical protein